MKVTPTTGKLIVQVEIPEDISEGGIVLPVDREGDPKDNPQIGVVIAIGPNPVDQAGIEEEAPAKVGQKILFKDFYMLTRPEEPDLVKRVEQYFVDFPDVIAIIED